MAAKRIEAIGDNGPELVPADEVVEIRAIPVGPGNMVIPATIRAIRKRGEGMPTRLRRIMRPNTRANPSPFVHVFFDCTPFARYMTENGPVMGDWSSCGLRGAVDAMDTLWQNLAPSERARLLAAARC